VPASSWCPRERQTGTQARTCSAAPTCLPLGLPNVGRQSGVRAQPGRVRSTRTDAFVWGSPPSTPTTKRSAVSASACGAWPPVSHLLPYILWALACTQQSTPSSDTVPFPIRKADRRRRVLCELPRLAINQLASRGCPVAPGPAVGRRLGVRPLARRRPSAAVGRAALALDVSPPLPACGVAPRPALVGLPARLARGSAGAPPAWVVKRRRAAAEHCQQLSKCGTTERAAPLAARLCEERQAKPRARPAVADPTRAAQPEQPARLGGGVGGGLRRAAVLVRHLPGGPGQVGDADGRDRPRAAPLPNHDRRCKGARPRAGALRACRVLRGGGGCGRIVSLARPACRQGGGQGRPCGGSEQGWPSRPAVRLRPALPPRAAAVGGGRRGALLQGLHAVLAARGARQRHHAAHRRQGHRLPQPPGIDVGVGLG